MDRKTRIMEIISSSDKPVSASKIAKELGVSQEPFRAEQGSAQYIPAQIN